MTMYFDDPDLKADCFEDNWHDKLSIMDLFPETHRKSKFFQVGLWAGVTLGIISSGLAIITGIVFAAPAVVMVSPSLIVTALLCAAAVCIGIALIPVILAAGGYLGGYIGGSLGIGVENFLSYFRSNKADNNEQHLRPAITSL